MPFKRKIERPQAPKRSTRTPLAVPRKKFTRDAAAKPGKSRVTR